VLVERAARNVAARGRVGRELRDWRELDEAELG